MIRTPRAIKLDQSLELTPLIDIIFIVVVFLLLTANPQLLSLPVDIPLTEEQAANARPSHNQLLISLHRDGPRWGINKQRFGDWQTFRNHLLPEITDKQRPLRVAPDRQAPVEALVQLLALLKEQQITNTQILMEAKP